MACMEKRMWISMEKDLNMVHGGLLCIIGGLVFLFSLLCVA